MRPHLAPPATPPAAPGRNPAAPRRTPRRTPRRADTARLLLEWGAAAEAKDNRGRVALHAAAAGGASMVVAALLARGALPSVVAAGGLTPLDLAVLKIRTFFCLGQTREVREDWYSLLLNCSAD